ncbi:MAG: class I SAM-dependent methyltransferase [Luteolibacter sp.]
MGFDRLAPFYRAMEFFTAGGKLQRCRMAFLDEIQVPAKILLAGEGHGRFLPVCVRRFPEAEIVMVDISARMLEIARTKVDADHVQFVHANFLEWDGPPGGFDLIVTNFFLDCFPADQLALVVSKLGHCATPDAQWLLADFEIAPTPLAGLRSRVIVGMLYAFFRIITGLKASALVPPESDLEKAGFSLHRRQTHDWGLLKSEWWRRNG